MKLIMYSSYIFSKRLVSVHLLAMQVLFIHSVSSLNLTNEYLNHKCRVSEGKYQSGSMYEENFNFLIKTVSSYDLRNGFEHISYGEDPNTVAFIFGCRGDSYGSKCRQCYATAIAGLRRRCERNKGGIIWYDQCFLDVSTIDQRTPRKIDYKNAFSLHNPNNVNGDTKSFNKNTEDFLYNLVQKGNRSPGVGNEPIYYASGEKRLGTHKLYAMVQCAKDIALCKDCLGWSIKELSKCCYGKQGARVLSTTCNLRYEIYPFLRTEKTMR